jgi:hypothetical protein
MTTITNVPMDQEVDRVDKQESVRAAFRLHIYLVRRLRTAFCGARKCQYSVAHVFTYTYAPRSAVRENNMKRPHRTYRYTYGTINDLRSHGWKCSGSCTSSRRLPYLGMHSVLRGLIVQFTILAITAWLTWRTSIDQLDSMMREAKFSWFILSLLVASVRCSSL